MLTISTKKLYLGIRNRGGKTRNFLKTAYQKLHLKNNNNTLGVHL